MNQIMLTVVGNAVADPDVGRTGGGVPRASFRVASSSRRYDRESGAWVNGEAVYLQVTCWRGLAENVATHVRKGSPVVVQGKLRSRTVTRVDESGEEQRRTYTEVEAVAVGLDLARLPFASDGSAKAA